MQQTMLALGALLIITTIAMNQQRSIFMLQRSVYLRELEAVADDYAKVMLNQVTQFAFDEARLGMATLNTDTHDLTAVASFGVEGGEASGNPLTFDDLDDLHGYVDSTATHVLSNETYTLRASYAVEYVDPANPTLPGGSATPTLVKRVTITVETTERIDSGFVRVVRSRPISISDYV